MNCDTIEELERYWQVQEQALGKFSPEIAITIAKLANLYLANGDFDRAQLLHQRGLDIKLKTAGTHQSEIDDSRRSLERVKEAREKSEKAKLAKGSNSGIPEYSPSAPTLSQNSQVIPPREAASSRRTPGPNAIKELELEITLLKQMVGNDHPAVADSLTKLADLYCREKLFSKMESPLIEALRIRESVFGPEHSSVATELKNIAQLYFVQERYALAEPIFERAIAIRAKNLGPSHPKVLDIQGLLVKLMKKTNRGAQAQDLERYLHEAKKESKLASSRVD
jgi:tetratricopeptide (TPR) repeat protein